MAAGGFLLMGAAAIGIIGFLAGLVLNPLAWLGIVSLGIAGVLFVTGQRLEGRSPGREAKGAADGARDKPAVKGKQAKAVEGKKAQPTVDDDMAEIEDILRRRGIQ
jgi:membrane protein implicated in regulation of membrane protease activity